MIDQTGSVPASLTSNNCRDMLERRAQALAAIRRYFTTQQVLEVETPHLGSFGVTDPQLENIRAEKPFSSNDWLYLQTSPEYAMKQLLAKGSGSIYQLGKAFRKDPVGRLHRQEFTLLEWYRVGFTMRELIDDVVAVVSKVLEGSFSKELVSYRQAFVKHLDIDPFLISLSELKRFAHRLVDIDADDTDRDFWLDLLFTHAVEPHLGKNGTLTFITEYPPSQAALAKLSKGDLGNSVAQRFELYIDGVELANGYCELTDAADYKQRFEEDNRKRQQLGLDEVAIDTEFLNAIESGIPACSGVALGFDRLMLFC